MNNWYKKFGKRIFDISISIFALIILSPILIMIALLVRIFLGKPVIFAQIRPGLNAKPFVIYKFRSMNNKKDVHGTLLPDSERITSFGQFLRNTSIDELPELINVIKGDMSLVGPRPLIMEYLERYSPFQARRHEIRPGITGWAQINGRNAISWEQKFKYDVWYVDNCTFFLDLKIMLLTILKTGKREGISQPGRATSDPFLG